MHKIATIYQGLFKDHLDFQGPLTGNIISQTVEKGTFPDHYNKTSWIFQFTCLKLMFYVIINYIDGFHGDVIKL